MFEIQAFVVVRVFGCLCAAVFISQDLVEANNLLTAHPYHINVARILCMVYDADIIIYVVFAGRIAM